MKKSFNLLELVLVLTLLGLLYTFFIPQTKIDKLEELTNRINIYLSYLRVQSLIDSQYDESTLWHKKRWTLKFFRCRESVGGIYFSIYSDKNKSGHPSLDESMKDPLTNKHIYTSNLCKESNQNSKYVLLTKNYNIEKVELTCNNTSGLGQISFGEDGKIYSRLSNIENEFQEFEITKTCKISFFDKNDRTKELIIYPKTAYSKKID